jgi:NAD(P)H-flavin reductase
MPRREPLRVTGVEPVGLYTLLRVDRGGLDPGVPGQFFMLEAPGRLLPRALSLCLAPDGELAFLIDPIGPGTEALCALEPGDRIHVFGPLGNGYRLDVARPLLVGGGIGMAPLPYLAEALRFPPVVLGFRTEAHAAAAALLPGAEVVIDPVLVTDCNVQGFDVLACGAPARARRAARAGSADGLRVRRVLRLRRRDRRAHEAPLRGRAGARCCLMRPGVSMRSPRPTSRAPSMRS